MSDISVALITILGTVASVSGVVIYVFNGTRNMIREMNQTMGKIEQAIGKMEQAIGKIEQSIGKIEQAMEKMEQTISEIHQTQKKIVELIERNP